MRTLAVDDLFRIEQIGPLLRQPFQPFPGRRDARLRAAKHVNPVRYVTSLEATRVYAES
jgi:hypothetical protein